MKKNVIIFGASGMVGKGVLLECLDHAEIESVLVVGRSSTGITHAKLKEIKHSDFTNYASIQNEFRGYDACYFCLGVSAVGMKEADYHRITHDFTLAAAKSILAVSPQLTFCFVSGAGTDSTEQGRTMWARVKGKTENALKNLGFAQVFLFRPGYIQPLRGIRSKVSWYQLIYDVFGFLYPLLKRLGPNVATNTSNVGLAMINVMLRGFDKRILTNKDINQLAS